MCSCLDCLEAIQLLDAGCRDFRLIGLRKPIVGLSWSRERGLFSEV